MQLPLVARFVERTSGRIVRGTIDRAIDEAIAAWIQWRYGREDEDRSWDWRSIYLESIKTPGRHECYAAWANDGLQGLMAMEILQEFGITVDYLATNPAYRMSSLGFKYVGTTLMGIAVLRSNELGFDGRIRLEALRGAETFYQGLGMTKQPDRSPEGNPVYVLDIDGAKELLEQIRERRILDL